MHRYVGKGRGGRKGFHKRGLLFALSETVVHFCVHPHTGTYIYVYSFPLERGTGDSCNWKWDIELALAGKMKSGVKVFAQ